ncbi:hypothetical protein J1P26_17380 [Neobacillus sp. MM2021_6]|uniref:hypothetical protein n=1 Tax=Bacillaceae TaxID=186817 RepID=UPI00140BF7C4|nr:MULTISPECIES: hypothetical protein [Bacillaceae]MBO0961481.1 hypothetical protein [Neobacillus sp. MM2021_6]NHC19585.1 hypothetical protein [Bacillus sp. MM2020_4]
MSIGKVTVWQMSEEQRLAYIAKHPIVPTERPKGTKFSNVTEMQYKKSVEDRGKKNMKRAMDAVDKEQLHKLFMSGTSIPDMAKAVNVSYAILNKYISQQRKIDLEKWPYRAKK